MDIHKSLTAKRLEKAAEARFLSGQDIGFCRSCGRKHIDVEIDASTASCSKCGTATVASAENLLMEVA